MPRVKSGRSKATSTSKSRPKMATANRINATVKPKTKVAKPVVTKASAVEGQLQPTKKTRLQKTTTAAKTLSRAVKKQAHQAAEKARKTAGGISERLLEVLQARSEKKAMQLEKKTGRRGRRPRQITESEFPSVGEEEEGQLNSGDYQVLEYDTGLKFAARAEDGLMSFDRADDFAEELNFDR